MMSSRIDYNGTAEDENSDYSCVNYYKNRRKAMAMVTFCCSYIYVDKYCNCTSFGILILIFSIMGVSLYFLIGLNGGTHKIEERYGYINRMLLLLLTENKECMEKIIDKITKAEKFIFME